MKKKKSKKKQVTMQCDLIGLHKLTDERPHELLDLHPIVIGAPGPTGHIFKNDSPNAKIPG